MKTLKCSILLTTIAAVSAFGIISGCAKKGAVSQAQVEEARALVKNYPNFENYIHLGLKLSETGKSKEALEAYTKSLDFAPNSAVAYNNICSELNQLGRWEEAVQNCRKSLALDPEFTLAANNLQIALDAQTRKTSSVQTPDAKILDDGLAIYQKKNYEAAIAKWKQISSSSEFYAQALNNRASAHIELKQFDMAEKLLTQAVKLSPNNPLFNSNQLWLAKARKESQKK